MQRFCLAAICGLWILVPGIAPAQNNTGRISGTITDTSGSIVPSAHITIINEATDLSWKTSTDKTGSYVMTNLPVGSYNVAVEAPGFRKALRAGYNLDDASAITADFKLEVGTVNQTMVVTEVMGETVNTVSGELSRVIDSDQVQDLALNGRNYMQLVTLIPGAALLDEDQMALTTSLSVTNQSINGNRTGSNHLMIDGGMNLDSGSNGSQINNVGIDFIKEVGIKTSAFSAEYGRNSGASINVVTKSGGDHLHGTLFETFRNDLLDARDYFAPSRPALRFNDFGWSLGGPIRKGKIYFFGGQEYKRIRRFTNPSRQTLPTRAERAGNFSDRATTNIYYPGTKTPIPGKDLSGLMSADGRAIMKVYDAMEKYAASYVDTPTSNNAVFQVLNPFNYREDIVKIDWVASSKHSVYARYLHDNYNTIDPFGTFNSSSLPTTPTLRDRPGYGPQLGDTWTISARWINQAKLNAAWNGQRTPLQGSNWQRETYGFQFPLFFGGDKYPNGIPDVTITNFASFNGPARVYLASPTTDITFSDTLSYFAGPHVFKGGIMIVRNRKDQNGRSVYDGSVAFNTSGNGNTSNYALADAALGNFRTYTEAVGDPVGFFRFTQYEGFLQDSWKVTRQFSVEIGLRYSNFVPTYTAGNNIVNFDPSLYDPRKAVQVTPAGLIVPGSGNPFNGLIRAGEGVPADQAGRIPGATSAAVLAVPAGAPRGLYPTANLFMPRFSFAWAPFRNSRTAIRAGFGTYHDRVQGNIIFSQTNLPPFSGQIQYENANLASASNGTAPALAPMGTINAINPHLKVPLVMTYNFGVQTELPWGAFLDVSYAGNQGRHLLTQPDINNPPFAALADNVAIPSAQRPVTNSLRRYAGYSSIRMRESDSNTNYNALQTYLTKRKGNVNLTVSYTWSHALGDASGDSDNPEEYESNRSFNYGPLSFDRRHIFVFTYTYRIPLLRNRHGFVGGALGRWEVSGVTRRQSGPPLTVTGSTSISTRRADYLGGDVALPSGERSPDHWFNTAAFKAAPNDRLGNAGVGNVVGPGLYLWDLSLRKEFPLFREGWKFRFQADAFNLMNHTNFRGLNVTTSSGSYGSVGSSGPARNIQFGARMTF